MESNRFFVVIQRINSLLFLLVLLGALALLSYVSWESSQRRARNAIQLAPEQAARTPTEFLAGRMESVRGLDVHYVAVEAREGGRGISKGYSTTTRNLLFLRGAVLTPQWLFETHQQLIQRHQPLFDASDEGNGPTRAFYYEVIKADSNGDGRLDGDDLRTLALSRADGSGYREIDSGITHVVERKVTDNGTTLLLLVQERGELVIKRYALRDFVKMSEQRIATLARTQ